LPFWKQLASDRKKAGAKVQNQAQADLVDKMSEGAELGTQ